VTPRPHQRGGFTVIRASARSAPSTSARVYQERAAEAPKHLDLDAVRLSRPWQIVSITARARAAARC
jgi:hypothetical protein